MSFLIKNTKSVNWSINNIRDSSSVDRWFEYKLERNENL